MYGLFRNTVIFGLIGAYLFTDSDYFKNETNNRPDLNHSRIMTYDAIPIKEKKVFEMFEGTTYFGKEFEDKNISIWKRAVHYFYPYYQYNPQASDYEPFFDYKKDYVTEDMKQNYHFKM